MKKHLTLTVVSMMLATFFVSAQDYIRSGKQFESVKTTKMSAPAERTGYTWKESNGDILDIYITKSGACYVMKVSKKTGKEYRKYLSKEIASQIALELGHEYKKD